MRGFSVYAITDTKMEMINGSTQSSIPLTVQALYSNPHHHGAFTRLSAEKIIEHHNWMWQHLSLPEGRSITLLTTDQLLEAAQPALAC